MTACAEFLDFVEQGLKIFGPSTRVRMQIGTLVRSFTLPPDPTWCAPPKRFQDTRNPAHSNKRGKGHGKGKGKK